MTIRRAEVDDTAFNLSLPLPYELRWLDFKIAMQDVYNFFFDVNSHLLGKGLDRLDEMLRAANMSGLISDMLTASLGKHSRSLVQNAYHNGHPDLIVRSEYPKNAVKAGDKGVEIKTTRKAGGAVDTHGARDQWLCTFVYQFDGETEPVSERAPMLFTAVYIGEVKKADFRKNPRGELGTRTATLDRSGIAKLRANWLYKLPSADA